MKLVVDEQLWLIGPPGRTLKGNPHVSKRSLATLAGAAALALMSIGAAAAPLSNNLSAVDSGVQSLVQPVHGCHRSVQDGAYGFHYHAGYDCRRIAVQQPRRHHYRGPVCRRECKYVGPIKVCKDRCY
jgi:hypothetical protein